MDRCSWKRVSGHWHTSCRDDIALRNTVPKDVNCPMCGRRIHIVSRAVKSDSLCPGCMRHVANEESGLCTECEVLYG